MFTKLVPKTVFGSFYLLVSIILLIVCVGVYIANVQSALGMDPNSYNCTSDSMMKNICHHPYTSSIYWTVLMIGVSGGPLIIAWIVIGLYLITRTPKPDSRNDN